MIIYFGLFAVITVWMLRQPGASVGALLCTYGLEQWAQSQSSFFWDRQWLTNIMTASVLLLALAIRFVKGKSVITPLTRDYWAAVALYGLAMVSVIWSIIPEETWGQFASSSKYIVVFTFLMPLAISDRHDLKATLYTLLTLGFAIAVMLLINSDWENRKIVFKQGVAIGALGLEGGNPLAIATLGGQVALVAMLMNFRGVARFWQIFRYAVIGVGFLLAVKSGSRGQTFAVVISALALMPYSRRFRDMKSFIGFCVSVAIFGVLIITLFEMATSSSTSVEADYNERWSLQSFVEAYQGGRVETSIQVLHAWLDGGPFRWLFGIGSSGSFHPNVVGMYPHVVFTEVLGELGLVGWAILWLTPIFAYKNLKALWPYVKDNAEERGNIAAWAGLLLFDIILSFKQGSLLGTCSTFGIAIITGRLLWSYRQEVAVYEQLDARGYAMTDADWEESQYDAIEDEEGLPANAAMR